MLTSLKATGRLTHAGTFDWKGPQHSFDPLKNDLIKEYRKPDTISRAADDMLGGTDEAITLDYVLYSTVHRKPTTVQQMLLAPKNSETGKDLSDHYALRSRMVFPVQ